MECNTFIGVFLATLPSLIVSAVGFYLLNRRLSSLLSSVIWYEKSLSDLMKD